VSGPHIRAVGDTALLLELPDNRTVHAAARVVRAQFGDRLAEVVPGHQTLLLVWRDGSTRVARAEIAALPVQSEQVTPGEAVTIATRYDGADLEDVAATLGMSREAVVELHSATAYTVAFMGFSPGFPYLVAPEGSRLLDLPRLATPRTEVPPGSVAVAAGYCGIYPYGSPGGWNLLGRTDVVLFDAERERPALLTPGTGVKFEAV
jgi:5-oxoprolinase (ATP-hydrolysing) subunit B